jgi:hypothetical protein
MVMLAFTKSVAIVYANLQLATKNNNKEVEKKC